jgi:hypothetical protein
VRSYGSAASASASSVWARRGAATTFGEADESQSLTAAERAAIDSAAEKMAWRATEEAQWDRTLFWTGIDTWTKVRYLGSALPPFG